MGADVLAHVSEGWDELVQPEEVELALALKLLLLELNRIVQTSLDLVEMNSVHCKSLMNAEQRVNNIWDRNKSGAL